MGLSPIPWEPWTLLFMAKPPSTHPPSFRPDVEPKESPNRARPSEPSAGFSWVAGAGGLAAASAASSVPDTSRMGLEDIHHFGSFGSALKERRKNPMNR
jgi:hypothetical protein